MRSFQSSSRKNEHSTYCEYDIVQPEYEYHEGHVSLHKIHRHYDAGFLPPNGVDFAVELSEDIIGLYDWRIVVSIQRSVG